MNSVWTQLAALLARMLLLLAGLLLPAALLLARFLSRVLLTGLLTRVLVLLTRILILIAHPELSLFALAVGTNAGAQDRLRRNSQETLSRTQRVPKAHFFGILHGDSLSRLGRPY